MIQWFNKNDKKMMATIYPTNITINKPGLDKISHASACMVGIDEEEKKIAIRPLTKTQFDSHLFDEGSIFVLSGGKTYTRISSTEFVNVISDLLGYDFKNGVKKFSCTYDDESDMLMIDLTKEVI